MRGGPGPFRGLAENSSQTKGGGWLGSAQVPLGRTRPPRRGPLSRQVLPSAGARGLLVPAPLGDLTRKPLKATAEGTQRVTSRSPRAEWPANVNLEGGGT